jgi:Fe-S cluster assembly iron-binding protein IscA
MVLLEQTETDQITLTASAADAVRELLAKRNLEGYALRVFVSGAVVQVFSMVWRLKATFGKTT